MLSTRFTELVGCTTPIQQAGMGPIANPRLAAAVSEAGGLGKVSVGASNARFAADALDEARAGTRAEPARES